MIENGKYLMVDLNKKDYLWNYLWDYCETKYLWVVPLNFPAIYSFGCSTVGKLKTESTEFMQEL